MDAEITYRGRTYKKVRITGTGQHSDEAVLDVALIAARESRASLFGWGVVRGENVAVVTLHTD